MNHPFRDRVLLSVILFGGLLGLLLAAAEPALAADLEQAKRQLHAKIGKLRWIAYSPSTFDPGAGKPLLKTDIQADLRVLKSAGFSGLVTYACSPAAETSPEPGNSAASESVGICDVPSIAKRMGFEGFIVGVWDPQSRPEREAAARLARDKLIDGVCVGNEGLDSRYSWETLREVMRAMRASAGVPVTTTEQIEDYGLPGMCDPAEVDWLFPNIHPVFHNIRGPDEAARWTILMATELRKLVGDEAAQKRLPVLIKETGWPTRGLDWHSEQSQKQFWGALQKLAAESAISYVTFEAFDQPWKHEQFQGGDIGTSWGVFSAAREPKLIIRSAGRSGPP
jgi:exo-beta-1,3-glucanase (GH17 family)